MHAVEIFVDWLTDGSAPVYESEANEEWYWLSEDGKTWRASQGKKVYLPEFEIVGLTERSCTRAMKIAIATICMLQEHGGTAVLALRDIRKVHIPDPDSFVWVLTGGLVVTERRHFKGRNGPGVMDLPDRMEVDSSTLKILESEEAVEEIHEA